MKKFLAISSAGLALIGAIPVVAAASFGMNMNGKFHLDDDKYVNTDISVNATVDVPCIQAAVKQRDDAFIAAFNTYNTALTNALKTREDAQVSAWAMVDVSQRSIALKASEKAFTSSYNDASRIFFKAKEDIKSSFKTAARACVTGHSSSSKSSTSSTSSSSSVACQNLTGTMQGAYSITSLIPDTGKTYNLTGSGTVNVVGSVSLSGTLHGLGFIATGNAMGDITLTHGSDSAVLHLVGPTQTGFSALPTMFNYTVQSSTGVFAQLNSKGTATLKLIGDNNGSFRLELHGNCDKHDHDDR